MDQKRFDHLAVTLVHGASRRQLLALLGGVVGPGLLPDGDVAGKRQRRRSKARHDHDHRSQRKRAKAKAQHTRQPAKAAACPLCKRLNSQGRCVADWRANFQCCTTAGKRRGFCLVGTCFAGQCSGPICNDQTCPDGCCDAAAQCHVNEATACGTGAGTCTPCAVTGEVCSGGDCVCPSGVSCSVSGCCPDASDVCNDADECCTKKTCADHPGQCGTLNDGCDGTITCGCPQGQTCGGGGTPNVCGSVPCVPKSCAQLGVQCGSVADGCGGFTNCGPCPTCQTCDGTGTCVRAVDGTSCPVGHCCNGACTFTAFDASHCGSCDHNCFALGGCGCENGTCCQCLAGDFAFCSATLPCCGGGTCRTDGPFAGTCCAATGTVTCYTDDPSFCCGTCIPNNAGCTGHCPGQCQGG